MATPHTTTTEFRPYIPDSANVPEFTIRAVLLGMIFGLIFGAVTVYVGLRAGLTVSASIPIAVLSISLLRALGKATILENNIVQTTGSAGESVAAGSSSPCPPSSSWASSSSTSASSCSRCSGGPWACCS